MEVEQSAALKKKFTYMVEQERLSQDSTWGIQNHMPDKWFLILSEEVGELAKATLECGNVENELVQIAAVCQAMFESGKRCGWL